MTVPIVPSTTCGLNMRNERVIAVPDLNMCCQMFLNRRDSRVFSFVSTGTEAMRRRLLPA